MIDNVGIRSTFRDRSSRWLDVEADNWDVELFYDGRTATFPFSKGVGHHGAEPTANQVLTCLIADASLYDECGDDPDEWRQYLGDDISIKDLLANMADVERQTQELERLFGDDWGEAQVVDWEVPLP